MSIAANKGVTQPIKANVIPAILYNNEKTIQTISAWET